MGFTNTFKTKKMAHMKAIRWLQENPTIFESLQAGAVMGTGDLIAQKLIEKKETIDTKRLAAFTGFGLFIAGPVLSTWYRFLDKKLPFCWPRLKRSFVKMVADQTLMAPVYLAVLLSYFELTVGRGLDGFKEELERKYPSTLANNYLGPSLRIWYGGLDKMFPSSGRKLQYKKVLVDQGIFAPAFIASILTLLMGINGEKPEAIKEKLKQDYKDILITNYKIWPAVMIVNFSFVPVNYQVLVTQTVAVLWNIYFAWKANQPVVKIE
ncbi:uncharacterized protein GBIM_00409 [Gryllus bimaculatus]|nr:uncharacterized protein GBIM_00409 [Gryllus bimaculatus]